MRSMPVLARPEGFEVNTSPDGDLRLPGAGVPGPGVPEHFTLVLSFGLLPSALHAGTTASSD